MRVPHPRAGDDENTERGRAARRPGAARRPRPGPVARRRPARARGGRPRPAGVGAGPARRGGPRRARRPAAVPGGAARRGARRLRGGRLPHGPGRGPRRAGPGAAARRPLERGHRRPRRGPGRRLRPRRLAGRPRGPPGAPRRRPGLPRPRGRREAGHRRAGGDPRRVPRPARRRRAGRGAGGDARRGRGTRPRPRAGLGDGPVHGGGDAGPHPGAHRRRRRPHRRGGRVGRRAPAGRDRRRPGRALRRLRPRAGARGGAHRDRVAPARRPDRGADGRRGRQPRVAGAAGAPPGRRPLARRGRADRQAPGPPHRGPADHGPAPHQALPAAGAGRHRHALAAGPGRLERGPPAGTAAARRGRGRRAAARGGRGPGVHARQAPARRHPRDRAGAGADARPLPLHARARAPGRRPRRGAPGPGDRRSARAHGGGGHLRGDRHLQAALPDLRRPPPGAQLLLRPDDRAARALRRAVPDRAGRDAVDVPGQRLQPRGDGEHALHAPPHGALPPRPHRRALRARHRQDRRPREAVAGAQGDAPAGPARLDRGREAAAAGRAPGLTATRPRRPRRRLGRADLEAVVGVGLGLVDDRPDDRVQVAERRQVASGAGDEPQQVELRVVRVGRVDRARRDRRQLGRDLGDGQRAAVVHQPVDDLARRQQLGGAVEVLRDPRPGGAHHEVRGGVVPLRVKRLLGLARHRAPFRPAGDYPGRPQRTGDRARERPWTAVSDRRSVHADHAHRPGQRVGQDDLARPAPGRLRQRLLAGAGRRDRDLARHPRQQAPGRRGRRAVLGRDQDVGQRRLAQSALGVEQEGVVGAGGLGPPLGGAVAGVGERLVLGQAVARPPGPAQGDRRDRGRLGGQRGRGGGLDQQGRPRRRRQAHAGRVGAGGGERGGHGLAHQGARRHRLQAEGGGRGFQAVEVALQQRHPAALGAHGLEQPLAPAHAGVVDRERGAGRGHQRPVEPDGPPALGHPPVAARKGAALAQASARSASGSESQTTAPPHQ